MDLNALEERIGKLEDTFKAKAVLVDKQKESMSRLEISLVMLQEKFEHFSDDIKERIYKIEAWKDRGNNNLSYDGMGSLVDSDYGAEEKNLKGKSIEVNLKTILLKILNAQTKMSDMQQMTISKSLEKMSSFPSFPY